MYIFVCFFFIFRGVRCPRRQRELPGPRPQVRSRPRHRRGGQEGQPVGRGEAQLHHGKKKEDSQDFPEDFMAWKFK